MISCWCSYTLLRGCRVSGGEVRVGGSVRVVVSGVLAGRCCVSLFRRVRGWAPVLFAWRLLVVVGAVAVLAVVWAADAFPLGSAVVFDVVLASYVGGCECLSAGPAREAVALSRGVGSLLTVCAWERARAGSCLCCVLVCDDYGWGLVVVFLRLLGAGVAVPF